MGALRYVPDKHIRAKKNIEDIGLLAAEVRKLLSEVDYDKIALEVLAEKGGSLGGARPKVLLNIDDTPWLVKFPSSSDPPDIGKIEYTYSLVAGKCGIEMPETALFEEQYFGVHRFDRQQRKRIHMHSASGMLYASFRYPSLDYIELIKATLALTKNMEDAYKLFRQMVFNILTGNKDDHAKNFAFIYQSGQWQLSPAYDLVRSNGFNNNHSTTIAGKGNPELDDIFEVAKESGLKRKKCKAIFDEVYQHSTAIRIGDW